MENRAVKRSLPQRPTPVPALVGYARGGEEAMKQDTREAMRKSRDMVTLGVTRTIHYHGRLRRTFWWPMVHPAEDPAATLVERLRASMTEGGSHHDNRARMLFALECYWKWHDREVKRVMLNWEALTNGKRLGKRGA